MLAADPAFAEVCDERRDAWLDALDALDAELAAYAPPVACSLDAPDGAEVSQ